MRHEDRIKAKLLPRIASWRTAFSDGTTGIHKTLDDLLWQYASFRTVIKIVSIANQKRDPDRPPLNQMVFEMISDGYWSRLLLGVRRLVDPAAISGRDGVYSLASVLCDIKACGHRITRQIYVSSVWDANPDLDHLEAIHWDELREAAKLGKAVWGDPELLRSRMAHDHFDFLSGTTAATRSSDDVLDVAIIEVIQGRLEKFRDITKHVDSHLAHAGNLQSRSGKLLEAFEIRDARACLKELKELSDLVGMWFGRASGAGLATFIGNQFEGLDSPMIGPERMGDLESVWQEIDNDISTWHLDRSQLSIGSSGIGDNERKQ